MHKLSINKNFIKSVTVNTNTYISTNTKDTYTRKENVRLCTAFKDQIV